MLKKSSKLSKFKTHQKKRQSLPKKRSKSPSKKWNQNLRKKSQKKRSQNLSKRNHKKLLSLKLLSNQKNLNPNLLNSASQSQKTDQAWDRSSKQMTKLQSITEALCSMVRNSTLATIEENHLI